MLSSLILSLALLVAPSAQAAEWPDLGSVPMQRSTEGRNDAVVIVAIEDYLKVDDVAGARSNAEAWMRWFLQGRGVPPSRIFKAFDGEATDLKLRELAKKAAGAVQPGGTVWFVFIGHGAPSKDGRDGLLVGVDADRSAEGIYGRSVPRTELLQLLGTGKQSQTVALLDACFSGQSGSGQALVAGLQPLIPTALAETAPSTRARVLTAAGSGEFAGPLAGASRPAFSYLALGGLMGWADVDGTGNRDGVVSASELREYVLGALNLTVSGRSQTPELLGSDAPLAKAAERKALDLMSFVRAPARGPAPSAPAPGAPAASAPPPAGSAKSTSFGGAALDVSAQLKEQACLDEARTKLAKQREQELSCESARVLAEGRSAWKTLSAQGEACTKLSDKAARQPCLSAIDSWLASAKSASVELSASSGAVPTACGPRNAADAARRASVDLSAEIAAAGELRKRVEQAGKAQGVGKAVAPERPSKPPEAGVPPRADSTQRCDDIAAMVDAAVPMKFIVHTIDDADWEFGAADLRCLKNAGVPSEILSAVRASMAVTGEPSAAQRGSPIGNTQSRFGYPMVELKVGSYLMGSPEEEQDRADDEDEHTVHLKKPFLLGTIEVTQELWASVTGTHPSRNARCGTRCPVENVSWCDAVIFANMLSLKEGLRPAYGVPPRIKLGSDLATCNDNASKVTWDAAANGYRLPTEAEWEYAARAGSRQSFGGRSDERDEEWVEGRRGGNKVHAVGQVSPNAWGLYDTTANVAEWTWDVYGPYLGVAVNPTGERRTRLNEWNVEGDSAYGAECVIRGGVSGGFPHFGRVASRSHQFCGWRLDTTGLRLARNAP